MPNYKGVFHAHFALCKILYWRCCPGNNIGHISGSFSGFRTSSFDSILLNEFAEVFGNAARKPSSIGQKGLLIEYMGFVLRES